MKAFWSLEKAISELGVELVDLRSDGEVPAGTHGWSKIESGNLLMAINDDTHFPRDLIAFHELGHLVLGHSRLPFAAQVMAYADMEVQAMQVAQILGREFLADSESEWGQEVEEYIQEYSFSRLAPQDKAEIARIASAVRIIREAGLVETSQLELELGLAG